VGFRLMNMEICNR